MDWAGQVHDDFASPGVAYFDYSNCRRRATRDLEHAERCFLSGMRGAGTSRYRRE